MLRGHGMFDRARIVFQPAYLYGHEEFLISGGAGDGDGDDADDEIEAGSRSVLGVANGSAAADSSGMLSGLVVGVSLRRLQIYSADATPMFASFTHVGDFGSAAFSRGEFETDICDKECAALLRSAQQMHWALHHGFTPRHDISPIALSSTVSKSDRTFIPSEAHERTRSNVQRSAFNWRQVEVEQARGKMLDEAERVFDVPLGDLVPRPQRSAVLALFPPVIPLHQYPYVFPVIDYHGAESAQTAEVAQRSKLARVAAQGAVANFAQAQALARAQELEQAQKQVQEQDQAKTPAAVDSTDNGAQTTPPRNERSFFGSNANGGVPLSGPLPPWLRSEPCNGLTVSEQDRVLSAFRRGEVNLIVTTSVAEEGIDITECDFVMMLDGVRSTQQYVQRRGRARANGAKIYLFHPDDADNARAAAIEAATRDKFVAAAADTAVAANATAPVVAAVREIAAAVATSPDELPPRQLEVYPGHSWTWRSATGPAASHRAPHSYDAAKADVAISDLWAREGKAGILRELQTLHRNMQRMLAAVGGLGGFVITDNVDNSTDTGRVAHQQLEEEEEEDDETTLVNYDGFGLDAENLPAQRAQGGAREKKLAFRDIYAVTYIKLPTVATELTAIEQIIATPTQAVQSGRRRRRRDGGKLAASVESPPAEPHIAVFVRHSVNDLTGRFPAYAVVDSTTGARVVSNNAYGLLSNFVQSIAMVQRDLFAPPPISLLRPPPAPTGLAIATLKEIYQAPLPPAVPGAETEWCDQLAKKEPNKPCRCVIIFDGVPVLNRITIPSGLKDTRKEARAHAAFLMVCRLRCLGMLTGRFEPSWAPSGGIASASRVAGSPRFGNSVLDAYVAIARNNSAVLEQLRSVARAPDEDEDGDDEAADDRRNGLISSLRGKLGLPSTIDRATVALAESSPEATEAEDDAPVAAPAHAPAKVPKAPAPPPEPIVVDEGPVIKLQPVKLAVKLRQAFSVVKSSTALPLVTVTNEDEDDDVTDAVASARRRHSRLNARDPCTAAAALLRRLARGRTWSGAEPVATALLTSVASDICAGRAEVAWMRLTELLKSHNMPPLTASKIDLAVCEKLTVSAAACVGSLVQSTAEVSLCTLLVAITRALVPAFAANGDTAATSAVIAAAVLVDCAAPTLLRVRLRIMLASLALWESRDIDQTVDIPNSITVFAPCRDAPTLPRSASTTARAASAMSLSPNAIAVLVFATQPPVGYIATATHDVSEWAAVAAAAARDAFALMAVSLDSDSAVAADAAAPDAMTDEILCDSITRARARRAAASSPLADVQAMVDVSPAHTEGAIAAESHHPVRCDVDVILPAAAAASLSAPAIAHAYDLPQPFGTIPFGASAIAEPVAISAEPVQPPAVALDPAVAPFASATPFGLPASQPFGQSFFPDFSSRARAALARVAPSAPTLPLSLPHRAAPAAASPAMSSVAHNAELFWHHVRLQPPAPAAADSVALPACPFKRAPSAYAMAAVPSTAPALSALDELELGDLRFRRWARVHARRERLTERPTAPHWVRERRRVAVGLSRTDSPDSVSVRAAVLALLVVPPCAHPETAVPMCSAATSSQAQHSVGDVVDDEGIEDVPVLSAPQLHIGALPSFGTYLSSLPPTLAPTPPELLSLSALSLGPAKLDLSLDTLSPGLNEGLPLEPSMGRVREVSPPPIGDRASAARLRERLHPRMHVPREPASDAEEREDSDSYSDDEYERDCALYLRGIVTSMAAPLTDLAKELNRLPDVLLGDMSEAAQNGAWIDAYASNRAKWFREQQISSPSQASEVSPRDDNAADAAEADAAEVSSASSVYSDSDAEEEAAEPHPSDVFPSMSAATGRRWARFEAAAADASLSDDATALASVTPWRSRVPHVFRVPASLFFATPSPLSAADGVTDVAPQSEWRWRQRRARRHAPLVPTLPAPLATLLWRFVWRVMHPRELLTVTDAAWAMAESISTPNTRGNASALTSYVAACAAATQSAAENSPNVAMLPTNLGSLQSSHFGRRAVGLRVKSNDMAIDVAWATPPPLPQLLQATLLALTALETQLISTSLNASTVRSASSLRSTVPSSSLSLSSTGPRSKHTFGASGITQAVFESIRLSMWTPPPPAPMTAASALDRHAQLRCARGVVMTAMAHLKAQGVMFPVSPALALSAPAADAAAAEAPAADEHRWPVYALTLLTTFEPEQPPEPLVGVLPPSALATPRPTAAATATAAAAAAAAAAATIGVELPPDAVVHMPFALALPRSLPPAVLETPLRLSANIYVIVAPAPAPVCVADSAASAVTARPQQLYLDLHPARAPLALDAVSRYHAHLLSYPLTATVGSALQPLLEARDGAVATVVSSGADADASALARASADSAAAELASAYAHAGRSGAPAPGPVRPRAAEALTHALAQSVPLSWQYAQPARVADERRDESESDDEDTPGQQLTREELELWDQQRQRRRQRCERAEVAEADAIAAAAACAALTDPTAAVKAYFFVPLEIPTAVPPVGVFANGEAPTIATLTEHALARLPQLTPPPRAVDWPVLLDAAHVPVYSPLVSAVDLAAQTGDKPSAAVLSFNDKLYYCPDVTAAACRCAWGNGCAGHCSSSRPSPAPAPAPASAINTLLQLPPLLAFCRSASTRPATSTRGSGLHRDCDAADLSAVHEVLRCPNTRSAAADIAPRIDRAKLCAKLIAQHISMRAKQNKRNRASTGSVSGIAGTAPKPLAYKYKRFDTDDGSLLISDRGPVLTPLSLTPWRKLLALTALPVSPARPLREAVEQAVRLASPLHPAAALAPDAGFVPLNANQAPLSATPPCCACCTDKQRRIVAYPLRPSFREAMQPPPWAAPETPFAAGPAATALAPLADNLARSVSKLTLIPPLDVMQSALVPAASRAAWAAYVSRAATAASATDERARRRAQWLSETAAQWTRSATSSVSLPYAWKHTPLIASPYLESSLTTLPADAAELKTYVPASVLLPPSDCLAVALRPMDAFFAPFLPFLADELEVSAGAWELGASLTLPAALGRAAPASAPESAMRDDDAPDGDIAKTDDISNDASHAEEPEDESDIDLVHTRVAGMAVADSHRPLVVAHLLARARAASRVDPLLRAAVRGPGTLTPSAVATAALRHVSWGAWLRSLEGETATSVPAVVSLHRHRVLTAYRLLDRTTGAHVSAARCRALLPSAPWLYLPLLLHALRLDRASDVADVRAGPQAGSVATLNVVRTPLSHGCLQSQMASAAVPNVQSSSLSSGQAAVVLRYHSESHGFFQLSSSSEAGATAITAAVASLHSHGTGPALLPVIYSPGVGATMSGNERLELLGDSFFKFFTASALTHAPTLFSKSEGKLAINKDEIVSNLNLARAARLPLRRICDSIAATETHTRLTTPQRPVAAAQSDAGVLVPDFKPGFVHERFAEGFAAAAGAVDAFAPAVTVAGCARFTRFERVMLRRSAAMLMQQANGTAMRATQRRRAAARAELTMETAMLQRLRTFLPSTCPHLSSVALPEPWMRALCLPAVPAALYPPLPVTGARNAALALPSLLASNRGSYWLPGAIPALSPLELAKQQPLATVSRPYSTAALLPPGNMRRSYARLSRAPGLPPLLATFTPGGGGREFRARELARRRELVFAALTELAVDEGRAVPTEDAVDTTQSADELARALKRVPPLPAAAKLLAGPGALVDEAELLVQPGNAGGWVRLLQRTTTLAAPHHVVGFEAPSAPAKYARIAVAEAGTEQLAKDSASIGHLTGLTLPANALAPAAAQVPAPSVMSPAMVDALYDPEEMDVASSVKAARVPKCLLDEATVAHARAVTTNLLDHGLHSKRFADTVEAVIGAALLHTPTLTTAPVWSAPSRAFRTLRSTDVNLCATLLLLPAFGDPRMWEEDWGFCGDRVDNACEVRSEAESGDAVAMLSRLHAVGSESDVDVEREGVSLKRLRSPSEGNISNNLFSPTRNVSAADDEVEHMLQAPAKSFASVLTVPKLLLAPQNAASALATNVLARLRVMPHSLLDCAVDAARPPAAADLESAIERALAAASDDEIIATLAPSISSRSSARASSSAKSDDAERIQSALDAYIAYDDFSFAQRVVASSLPRCLSGNAEVVELANKACDVQPVRGAVGAGAFMLASSHSDTPDEAVAALQHGLCTSLPHSLPALAASVSLLQAGHDPATTAAVEALLGYTFRDKALLVAALTHASWWSLGQRSQFAQPEVALEDESFTDESSSLSVAPLTDQQRELLTRHPVSHERLELLGDSVLDTVVTSHLFRRCPHVSPDALHYLRRQIVCNSVLARVAATLGLFKTYRCFNARSSADANALMNSIATVASDTNQLIWTTSASLVGAAFAPLTAPVCFAGPLQIYSAMSWTPSTTSNGTTAKLLLEKKGFADIFVSKSEDEAAATVRVRAVKQVDESLQRELTAAQAAIETLDFGRAEKGFFVSSEQQARRELCNRRLLTVEHTIESWAASTSAQAFQLAATMRGHRVMATNAITAVANVRASAARAFSTVQRGVTSYGLQLPSTAAGPLLASVAVVACLPPDSEEISGFQTAQDIALHSLTMSSPALLPSLVPTSADARVAALADLRWGFAGSQSSSALWTKVATAAARTSAIPTAPSAELENTHHPKMLADLIEALLGAVFLDAAAATAAAHADMVAGGAAEAARPSPLDVCWAVVQQLLEPCLSPTPAEVAAVGAVPRSIVNAVLKTVSHQQQMYDKQ